jgi:hypothetical protein
MARKETRKPIGQLPPERAFVLQIEADADLAAGKIGGRVEHVTSGRATWFHSLRQLLLFLRDVPHSVVNDAIPAPPPPNNLESDGESEE